MMTSTPATNGALHGGVLPLPIPLLAAPLLPAPGPLPTALQGKWQCGVFDMATFWAYDGRYQGLPFEQAVAFDFQPDGMYEKYTMNTLRDYSNCATEAFGYERGRVVFHPAPCVLEMQPLEGHSRQFHSCFPNLDWSRWRHRSELMPQTYTCRLWATDHGLPALLLDARQARQPAGVFVAAAW